MMTKRVLSTATLWGGLGVLLWFGGTTCAVFLVGLVSLLTLREFYQIQAAAGQAPAPAYSSHRTATTTFSAGAKKRAAGLGSALPIQADACGLPRPGGAGRV